MLPTASANWCKPLKYHRPHVNLFFLFHFFKSLPGAVSPTAPLFSTSLTVDFKRIYILWTEKSCYAAKRSTLLFIFYFLFTLSSRFYFYNKCMMCLQVRMMCCFLQRVAWFPPSRLNGKTRCLAAPALYSTVFQNSLACAEWNTLQQLGSRSDTHTHEMETVSFLPLTFRGQRHFLRYQSKGNKRSD